MKNIELSRQPLSTHVKIYLLIVQICFDAVMRVVETDFLTALVNDYYERGFVS